MFASIVGLISRAASRYAQFLAALPPASLRHVLFGL
jgi:hypothetical protein